VDPDGLTAVQLPGMTISAVRSRFPDFTRWLGDKVNSYGQLVSGERRAESPSEAMLACRAQAFRLGVGVAADVLALGKAYTAARAVYPTWRAYRTNIALPLTIPNQIQAGNMAVMRSAGVDAAMAHGVGAVVMSPISLQPDRDGQLGLRQVVAAVAVAAVPLSGARSQVERTYAACNPE
jgi:hypothetical protein